MSSSGSRDAVFVSETGFILSQKSRHPPLASGYLYFINDGRSFLVQVLEPGDRIPEIHGTPSDERDAEDPAPLIVVVDALPESMLRDLAAKHRPPRSW